MTATSERGTVIGSRNVFARQLFAGLPGRYDLLAEVLSMGQNGRWRRAMVDHMVTGHPRLVLDVAAGPGGEALQLADRSSTRVVGIDLSPDMIGRGAKNVRAADMEDRISLVLGRGEQLPFPDESFDGLMFTYLLRYVEDPAAALAELARVVRPGGTIASLEFYVPPKAFWRAAWVFYTRVLLPAGGYIGGGKEWYEVGKFLGPNITQHYRRYPLVWTVDAWQRAGITNVGVRPMSLGGGLVMWGTKA